MPPTLHVKETNERIALGSIAVPLRVVKQAEALAPAGGAQRIIAGVSSFGFGGTNAHAIVASAGEFYFIQPLTFLRILSQFDFARCPRKKNISVHFSPQ